MLRSDIGNFLRLLREECIPKLTLKELADEFGVSESYLSQIENGKKPSEKILQNYIKKFNLLISDIYTVKNSNLIGLELKDQREKSGIDLGELEDLTGIPFFRLADIEEGHEDPTPEEISKICKSLNLDFDHFENTEMILYNQLRHLLKKFNLSRHEIDNIINFVKKRSSLK